VWPQTHRSRLVGFSWAVDLKISATCIGAQSTSGGAADITNVTGVDRGQRHLRADRECASLCLSYSGSEFYA